MYEAYRSFYTFRQQPGTSNSEYLEQFINVVDVLEQHGGCIGEDKLFLEHDEEYSDLKKGQKCSKKSGSNSEK